MQDHANNEPRNSSDAKTFGKTETGSSLTEAINTGGVG